jgi:hypothetical protein
LQYSGNAARNGAKSLPYRSAATAANLGRERPGAQVAQGRI